jgi:hypothetical protein
VLFDRLLPSQKEQEEAATGDLPEGTLNSNKETDAVGERVKVQRDSITTQDFFFSFFYWAGLAGTRSFFSFSFIAYRLSD